MTYHGKKLGLRDDVTEVSLYDLLNRTPLRVPRWGPHFLEALMLLLQSSGSDLGFLSPKPYNLDPKPSRTFWVILCDIVRDSCFGSSHVSLQQSSIEKDLLTAG